LEGGENMNTAMTVAMQTLKVLGGALGVLLLGALFTLARQWAAKIKDERLREFVFDVVKAAEKIFEGQSGVSNAKLAYVEKAVGGLPVTRTMIEAAVHDLHCECR